MPVRLRHRFLRRKQCEQDEAVHLLLVFDGSSTARVKPSFRVLGHVRDETCHLARQIGGSFLG